MHSVLNVKAGDRFGRLLVLETTQSGYSKNPSISKCKCDCGVIINIMTIRLWKMKSCGCMVNKAAYNKSHPKTWRAWQGMKARCFRKTNPRYPEWGGRGITVCDGMRYNIDYFISIVGHPPTPDHSLDRKDNDKNYSCGNCGHCKSNGWELNIRWATATQQSQNRGFAKKYDFDGDQLCLSEICRRVNLPMKTVHARLSNGWSFNKAITTPIK